jgi:hypothetical protein
MTIFSLAFEPTAFAIFILLVIIGTLENLNHSLHAFRQEFL